MLRLEDYNQGLIYNEVKDCIGCGKCIHECPILRANVSVAHGDGNNKMCVDEKECILCGLCIDTCIHDVRHYKDDCDQFFSDLKQGKSFSVLMAPSFCLNYPVEHKNVLGYLRSLGVKNFYSVSFGADIAIWGYLNYIARNGKANYITQPCPTIVSCIEKHLPELLPNLIPVQSPMMCTAIYLKRYIGIEEDLVFLSPCVAKKNEIQSERGLGLIRHNITFKNLMRHIKEQKVDLVDFPCAEDALEYGMGSLFPVPGGLRENIEHYRSHEVFTVQVGGEHRAYEYLKSYAIGIARQPESMPMLVDILSCERGCLYGTGTEFRSTNNDKIAHQAFLTRGKKIGAMKDQNQKALLDPALRLSQLNEVFKDLRLDDFICKYSADSVINTRTVVTDVEIETILSEKLMKLTDNDQHVDCTACGYRTCYQMAEAIALGINHHNNCVYFVRDALAKSIEELSVAEKMRAIYDSMRLMEQRLKSMLEASPILCAVYDENYNCLEVNQAAAEMLDLSDKQEYIDRLHDFYPEYQPDGTESHDKVSQIIDRAFEEGSLKSEWTFLHPQTKALIPCEVYLERVELGESTVIMVYIWDLREQHDMLRKLEDAINREQEASRAKTKFLSNVSHEIRTPLNSVMGIAELQLQKDTHTAETTDAFMRIRNSSDLLLSIINDLLDLSKVEAGKMEIISVEYDTASLIVDTVQLNIVCIGSKKIDFKLSVDEMLPASLIGDEIRIKQVLNNIISNAFKYTIEGTVSLSFYAEPIEGSEDVMLVVAVTDTGQGMTEKQIDSLFGDDFTRFNLRSNRDVEGSGLGLVIANRLVNMMGGEISVSSKPGEGSTFIASFLQKKKNEDILGPEVVTSLQDMEDTTKSLKKIEYVKRSPMPYGSVLVVDDVDSNLYVAKSFLMPYGLEIDTASCAAQAISKIKYGQVYDIIFMDHMMPDMDGIEATQIIRSMGYEHPIVALTANALSGASEMFLRNGFTEFIAKPIDIQHLNNILNQFIRDKYPQEAEKHKSEDAAETEIAEMDPKLLQVFCDDAEKAIITLRETFTSGNLKLFTTTAHAMKSALANVGEHDASLHAEKLEHTGYKGDTYGFIKTLEGIISKFKSAQSDIADDADITEDTDFLIRELQIIKAASEDYNARIAYASLDLLKKEVWKAQTLATLEQIRDTLSIYSDFEGAAKIAEELLHVEKSKNM